MANVRFSGNIQNGPETSYRCKKARTYSKTSGVRLGTI